MFLLSLTRYSNSIRSFLAAEPFIASHKAIKPAYKDCPYLKKVLKPLKIRKKIADFGDFDVESIRNNHANYINPSKPKDWLRR